MKNYSIRFILLLSLLGFLVLLALSQGRYAIPLSDVLNTLLLNNDNQMQHNIIFNLRLPRVIGAILVGAALSIAGTTYQGIFRNPLVSPDILGVSNGACIGAALGILLSIIWYIKMCFFVSF